MVAHFYAKMNLSFKLFQIFSFLEFEIESEIIDGKGDPARGSLTTVGDTLGTKGPASGSYDKLIVNKESQVKLTW